MRVLCRRPLVAVYLLCVFAAIARGAEPAPFVRTQRGELPIILSAPHGGKLDVPDVDVRKGEGLKAGGSGFVVSHSNSSSAITPNDPVSEQCNRHRLAAGLGWWVASAKDGTDVQDSHLTMAIRSEPQADECPVVTAIRGVIQ